MASLTLTTNGAKCRPLLLRTLHNLIRCEHFAARWSLSLLASRARRPGMTRDAWLVLIETSVGSTPAEMWPSCALKKQSFCSSRWDSLCPTWLRMCLALANLTLEEYVTAEACYGGVVARWRSKKTLHVAKRQLVTIYQRSGTPQTNIYANSRNKKNRQDRGPCRSHADTQGGEGDLSSCGSGEKCGVMS